MLKAAVIAVLLIAPAAASRFLSDWLLQVFESSNLTSEQQILIPLATVVISAVFIAMLESNRVRPISWPWHRFWYLYELSRGGATDDRPLHLPDRESVVEVLVDGTRRGLVQHLMEEILAPTDGAKRYLVLGESGSGKTVAMQQLELALALKGRWSGWRQPIPILIRMSQYQKGSLLGEIGRKLELATKGRSGKVLSESIDEFIRKGQVALLFDAIDETAENMREHVLKELKEFSSRAYEDVHLVITGRTRDEGHLRLGEMNLRQLEVQELSRDAVSVFIDAYKPADASEQDIRHRLKQNYLDIPGAIGRNPFWLTLIVQNGVFAERKADILLESINALFEREWDRKGPAKRSWNRVSSLGRDDQLQYTKRAIAKLAQHMAKRRKLSTSLENARSIVGQFLTDDLGEKKLTHKDVIELCRDAQILEYAENKDSFGPRSPELQFRHNLLLQFLAVYAALGEKEQLTTDFVSSQAADAEWWQTLFLADDLLRKRDSNKAYGNHALMVNSVFAEGSDGRRAFLALTLLWASDKFWDHTWDGWNRVIGNLSRKLAEDITIGHKNAAIRLSMLAPKRFIAGIEHLLNAASPQSQQNIVRLLEAVLRDQLEKGYAGPLLTFMFESHNLREPARKLAVSVGETAVEALIEVLRQTTEFAQVAAIQALGLLADLRAVEPLTKQLEQANVNTVRQIVWALGEIGDPSSIPAIVGTQEKAPDDILLLPGNVSEAIAKMGEPAIAQLISMLDQDQWGFTVSFYFAPAALIEIGQPAVESLIDALDSKSTYVQRYAAKCLGDIGDARAVEPLAKLALNADFLVSLNAFTALGKLGVPAVDALIRLLDQAKDPTAFLFTNSISALEEIGEPAVGPLLVATRSGSWYVRQGAAQALGRIGDQRAYETLCSLLKTDPKEEVRRGAAESLGLLGDEKALVPLKEALNDTDKMVQLISLLSMSRLQYAPATNRLYTLVQSGLTSVDREDNLFVRHYIAREMAAFEGAQIFPYLEDLLDEIEEQPYAPGTKQEYLSEHLKIAKDLANVDNYKPWLFQYLERIAVYADTLGTSEGSKIAIDIREFTEQLEEGKEE